MKFSSDRDARVIRQNRHHSNIQCRVKLFCTWLAIRMLFALLICAAGMLKATLSAQTALPFEVSNPKHINWSTDEAGRIYMSACELVARSIRPERPPRLVPKFVLVLGASEDETVRKGSRSEVRLKTWNPVRFAKAMVLMATREIFKDDDVEHLTRDTLITARASVSVGELKQKK